MVEIDQDVLWHRRCWFATSKPVTAGTLVYFRDAPIGKVVSSEDRDGGFYVELQTRNDFPHLATLHPKLVRIGDEK